MKLLHNVILVVLGIAFVAAVTVSAVRFIDVDAARAFLSESARSAQLPAVSGSPTAPTVSPSVDWAEVFASTRTATVVARAAPEMPGNATDVRPGDVTATLSPENGPGGDVTPRTTSTRSPAATPTATRVSPTPQPAALLSGSANGGGTYVVQAGDSLAAIATRFGTTVEAIVQANDLKRGQFVWMGQELRIPSGEDSAEVLATERAMATPAAKPAPPGVAVLAKCDVVEGVELETLQTPEAIAWSNQFYYAVQPGDTLGRIARQYGTSVDAILTVNTIPDRDRIAAGDRLVIPIVSDAVVLASRVQPGSADITRVTAVAARAPESAEGAKPVSPPGKIVFQTGMGGDIYILDVASGAVKYLTTGMEPDLSPDGKRVVFTRWGDDHGIFVINVDGTGEAKVFAIDQPRQAAWSPDGTRIAFSYQRGSRDTESHDAEGKLYRATEYFWHIGVVGVDGRGFAELPTSSNQNFSPTWSPDGVYVAFSGGEGLLLSAPDGFYRELTHGSWNESPAWSPAGGHIVYMTRRHDHFDLFLRPLQPALADEQPFLTGNKGIEQVALTSPALFADRPANNVAPSWSPAGDRIAFLSDRDGRWEIYVMDADGQNQRRLFDSGMNGIEINYEFVRDRTLSWGK